MEIIVKPLDYWNAPGKSSYYRAKNYLGAYIDEFYRSLSATELIDIIDPVNNNIIYLQDRLNSAYPAPYRRFVDLTENLLQKAIMALRGITGSEVHILTLCSREIILYIKKHLGISNQKYLENRILQLKTGKITPFEFMSFFIG